MTQIRSCAGTGRDSKRSHLVCVYVTSYALCFVRSTGIAALFLLLLYCAYILLSDRSRKCEMDSKVSDEKRETEQCKTQFSAMNSKCSPCSILRECQREQTYVFSQFRKGIKWAILYPTIAYEMQIKVKRHRDISKYTDLAGRHIQYFALHRWLRVLM